MLTSYFHSPCLADSGHTFILVLGAREALALEIGDQIFYLGDQREITANPKLKKTKVTLLSQTLKVEENKVPLILPMFAQGLRYSLFFIFCQQHHQGAILEVRKCLYFSL